MRKTRGKTTLIQVNFMGNLILWKIQIREIKLPQNCNLIFVLNYNRRPKMVRYRREKSNSSIFIFCYKMLKKFLVFLFRKVSRLGGRGLNVPSPVQWRRHGGHGGIFPPKYFLAPPKSSQMC